MYKDYKMIDEDGNEITSPDQLNYLDKAYLQAIRNDALAYKLQHGTLSKYTGLNAPRCKDGMEVILGIDINHGIHNELAICYYLELVENYSPGGLGYYDPSRGHGTILTDKGWKYLEELGI